MKVSTLVACAALSLLSVACGSDGKVSRTINSTGGWTVYADPYGDGRANPAQGVTGTVEALEYEDGSTRVTLNVVGATPSRHWRTMETSASFEARYAPSSYPTISNFSLENGFSRGKGLS